MGSDVFTLGVDESSEQPPLKKFKALFDDREGQVNHAGREYHAVFTGFTATEAKAACDTVSGKDLPCQTVAPR